MRSEPRYYDREGRPIGWERCAELAADQNYAFVAETLEYGCRISTIWLGLSQENWKDPPRIFETMIFRNGQMLDYQRRYATAEQAAEGHRRAVAFAEDLAAGFVCPDCGAVSHDIDDIAEGFCPICGKVTRRE